tara:strand:- start:1405 stop:2313 length:909 start_codon:yes stop_codon:yes gene_type:complete
MGYKTYWFSTNGENNYNNEKLDNFDNVLFIVHGREAKNLPINNSSIYLCHNIDFTGDSKKIPNNHIKKDIYIKDNIGIDIKNIIYFQVYISDCITRDIEDKNLKYHYINKSLKTLYFPWATDLLPFEIDKNINNINNFKSKNISNFIGCETKPWKIYKSKLNKFNIKYYNYGGNFKSNNKSIQDNIKLIQESIITPSLQNDWQVNHEYIPCRIFKNISYGKMGITNNKAVNKLFDNKLIYSNNIEELIIKGLEFEKNKNKNKNNLLKELMIEVRDKHTYINRIDFIFDFLKNKNIYISKQIS